MVVRRWSLGGGGEVSFTAKIVVNKNQGNKRITGNNLNHHLPIRYFFLKFHPQS